jgi:hypothetical protein
MSVLARNRKESDIEFLNTAFELEKYTIKACHNEKIIPKRYRLTKGNDLMSASNRIGNAVIKANSIKVETTKQYNQRLELLRGAIYDIQIMLKDLRLVSEVITSIKDNALEDWTGLLLKEESLIKGLMKSDYSRYSSLK